MAGTSDCKENHLEKNRGSQVPYARKKILASQRVAGCPVGQVVSSWFSCRGHQGQGKGERRLIFCHLPQSSSAVMPSQRKIW